MAKAANASRYYGTGRRKKSIARVYLTPGTGNITINKRNIDEYFGLEKRSLREHSLHSVFNNLFRFLSQLLFQGCLFHTANVR